MNRTCSANSDLLGSSNSKYVTFLLISGGIFLSFSRKNTYCPLVFQIGIPSLIVCIIPGCSRKKCMLVRIQNVGIEYLFIEVK